MDLIGHKYSNSNICQYINLLSLIYIALLKNLDALKLMDSLMYLSSIK